MSRFLNVVILILALLSSIVIARLLTTTTSFVTIAFVAAIAVVVPTFIKPSIGVYILTISMLLSPEIKLAELAERAIIVRLDDIFIIVVSITWLVRSAIYKQAKLFKKTPLNIPVILYIAICITSSLLGVLRGTAPPIISFFHTMKYIEYLLLYFVVVNTIDSLPQVKKILGLALAVSIIVTIHAYYQMSLGSSPYCPFDIERGLVESATLGGYLIIVFSMLLGMIVYEKKLTVLLLYLLLFVINIQPFIRTLSRVSYLSFAVLAVFFIFMTKKRRFLYLGTLLVGLFIFFTTSRGLIETMQQRIKYTVSGAGRPTAARVAGLDLSLEESAATRVKSWRMIFTDFLPKNPLLGRGISILRVEGQIPLVIGTTGVLGLIVFSWMLVVIWRETRKLHKTHNDTFVQAISLGFSTAFIGIFTHSLTTNTFIIIRIMEPFWLITGLIMVLRNAQDFQQISDFSGSVSDERIMRGSI